MSEISPTHREMLASVRDDPAKVVRTALQDGASIASLLVTTEALVAEKPKTPATHAAATPPTGF